MLKYFIAVLFLLIALGYVHFFAFPEAHAECSSGYTQITVPLCQPVPTCSSSSATTNQMGIILPCSPNVVTSNQISSPALLDLGITDANATVSASPQQIVIKALGSLNVEVWTHGAMAVRLTQGSGSMFTGLLDLSAEPAGPLTVEFNAYDVVPGGSPTVHLQGRYKLFVAGTRPAIPTPAPASGMTLAFSDHFTTLNSTPCKPGTGTWPSCTAPTASDGFKWYEGLFTGQDFGDCANEHTDSVNGYNPFTILPQGGLRIRNTFDPAYVDPYGFGRKQRCGILGTGYPDKSASAPGLTDGYYDARILIPNSFCNVPGDNTCSGGTWPSFWMLELSDQTHGGMEMDMTEMFGNDIHYHQAFTHAYAPAFFPASPNGGYAGYPLGSGADLTWDWHTVGMKISNSGSATGTVCEYFDEVQLKCDSFPQYSSPNSAVKPLWAPMLELASGGGWVSLPPPSGKYDLFVDWVGVWH